MAPRFVVMVCSRSNSGLPWRRLTAAFLLGGIACAHAATFTVVNTNDSGPGSLRQAITDANGSAGLDNIHFSIPGTAPFTINLSSGLVPIIEPVVIDGTSQPGYVNKPLVVLDGNSVGGTVNGLTISASGVTVKGLAIGAFSKYGIEMNVVGSNTVQGCFIGTDASGTVIRANSYGGIHLGSSSDNWIGGTNANEGNLISGNGNDGIWVDGSPAAARNVIVGNHIGTAWGGVAPMGNQRQGIRISFGQSNTVGGSVAAARNVVSGNLESGITVEGNTSTNNVIRGNYVGTDVTGTLAVSNAHYGVRILAGARNNLVGGVNAGEGNVISGNGKSGVDLSNGNQNNSVQGNFIGTSKTGTLALGNAELGIAMSAATNNLVGGTASGARNVISGNGQSGIYVVGSASRSNRMEGNYIGVDATGTNRLANGFAGIWLSDTPFNTVGSSVAGGGNVISGNNFHGIYIRYGGAFSNLVVGNYIGTDKTGSKIIWSASAYHGVVIDDAPGNVIGGSSSGARNVISGNYNGVALTGNSAIGNIIQGNFISTDSTGLIAVRNYDDGIKIGLSGMPSNTLVGGTALGAGNLISGGGYRGIYVKSASGTVIEGNRLGIKADLSGPLKNGVHNIDVETTASATLVGGTNAGAENIIAYAPNVAGYDGVRIRSGINATRVIGNSIYANGDSNLAGLGIDVNDDGVTPNDGCDADAGANSAQNFPTLLHVASDGAATVVKGYLGSAAGQAYLLQFYASPAPDSSGYGEGQLYLGSANVTLGAICSNSFSATLTKGAPAGWVLAATATDSANNTSEFSQSVPVGAVPQLSILSTNVGQVSLAWLVTNAYGGSWQLVQSTNLAPPIVWSTVTNSPTVTSNGTWYSVALPVGSGTRFFRLRYQ